MMKRMMAVLLALALCFGVALAENEATLLTVQGTAVVMVDPDVVCISANAVTVAESAMIAQEKNGETVAAMKTRLLALGLTEDDIVTQSYSFYPMYNYVDGGQVLVGYQASHMLEITCHDLTMLNDVLTAVTESGVNEVYNISYSVSERSGLYRQALCEATQAAREKAEQIAASCGYQSVRLVSVTEKNVGGDLVYANSFREEAAGAKMDAGINAGSVGVSASVEVVFAAE